MGFIDRIFPDIDAEAEEERASESAFADVDDEPWMHADDIVGWMDDPTEVLAQIIRVITKPHDDGREGKLEALEAIVEHHVKQYAEHYAEQAAEQHLRSLP